VTPAHRILEPVLHLPETRHLKAFIATIDEDLADFSRAKTGFLARLLDYVLTGSGKRVRPALVHLSASFGPADPAAVKQVALAVESIHIATLVHDDIIDAAAIRRQKPTVSAAQGDGAAVLLGDYVYAQSFQRLARLHDPDLLRLFADTSMVICEGEIGQVERRFQFDLTEGEYLEFLDKKTASLMAAACRAGARLAGLSARQQEALDRFGRLTGMAFQVVDDILDLEGEEAVTGKTLRTDLLHGKMTLPLIHYRAKMPASEHAAFFETLRDPGGRLADLIRRVREAGAMESSRALVRTYLREAEEALAALPDHPSRRLLSDLALRLSDRQV
jgi:heptaprenyl diphosphate synthase